MRRILSLVAFLFAGGAVGQEAPIRIPDQPTIGGVRLGMDKLGRELLCLQLDERNKGLDLVAPVEVKCSGERARKIAFTTGGEASEESLCRLARTPLSLVVRRLKPIFVRRSEPARPALDVAAKLEPWGVRTFAGLLDASGFERIALGRGTNRIERAVHELLRCFPG